MKTPHTLSSGRDIFLHHEGPITKQPISGMTEWVSALRSGKYEQCANKLHTIVGFCCLGVKRDLEGAVWKEYDGKFMDTTADHQLYFYNGGCGLSEEGTFPSQIQVSFEKFPDDGMPSYWERADRLSSLNDQGFSFSEISDIIELLFTDK